MERKEDKDMHIDEWGKRVSDKGLNDYNPFKIKRKSNRVTLKMKEVAAKIAKRRIYTKIAWQSGYDQAIADYFNNGG